MESRRAVAGCPEAPGLCGRAGVALEWAQGNWSVSLEGEEAGSGSGSGSGHGGAERADGRAMLSSIWEAEGLQTVGIVVLVIASIKLLHLLGLISFSEGKTLARSRRRQLLPPAGAPSLGRENVSEESDVREVPLRKRSFKSFIVLKPSKVAARGPARPAGVRAGAALSAARLVFYKHAALSIRMIDREKRCCGLREGRAAAAGKRWPDLPSVWMAQGGDGERLHPSVNRRQLNAGPPSRPPSPGNSPSAAIF